MGTDTSNFQMPSSRALNIAAVAPEDTSRLPGLEPAGFTAAFPKELESFAYVQSYCLRGLASKHPETRC